MSFTLSAMAQNASVPLYRLQDDRGYCLLTTSPGERDATVHQGWRLVGTVGYAGPDDAPSLAPLYRLFCLGNGDHLYTTSAAERDQALSRGYADQHDDASEVQGQEMSLAGNHVMAGMALGPMRGPGRPLPIARRRGRAPFL